jgi:AraC-like DNA-binding protein
MTKKITIGNFTSDERKEAVYRRLVNPQLLDELKDRILEQLVVRKKYRDGLYTARQLAADLQTNSRYISAVIRVHFHTTYTSLVNKYRVEEALTLLTDSRYQHYGVEEIGDLVGFAHRQSFHSAFVRFVGTTPKAYRMSYEQNKDQIIPSKPQTKKKKQ